MPGKSLIKINRDYRIDLQKANFEYISIPDDDEVIEELKKKEEENENAKKIKDIVEPKLIDNYEIEDFDDETVSIKFTRKRFFQPKIIYKINVTMNIVYDINQESNKELNKENLEKEINENTDKILRPVISKASLLISNITNADDDLLVITPPLFFQE